MNIDTALFHYQSEQIISFRNCSNNDPFLEKKKPFIIHLLPTQVVTGNIIYSRSTRVRTILWTNCVFDLSHGQLVDISFGNVISRNEETMSYFYTTKFSQRFNDLKTVL
jgi:hypothetical protein